MLIQAWEKSQIFLKNNTFVVCHHCIISRWIQKYYHSLNLMWTILSLQRQLRKVTFMSIVKKKHGNNDVMEVQLVKRINKEDSIIINSAIYEKFNGSQFKLRQINIFEYLDNNSYIESIQYYSNDAKKMNF